MANEGFGMLLMVGLGALALTSGKIGKTPTKAGTIVGDTMPREQPSGTGFDIAGYIQTLFGQTATVPVEPPVTFFYPKSVVVTSSGVPAVVKTPPEIITDTTKVQIGGEGGRTIVQSSLAIIRDEQVAKQAFAHAANADRRTAPEGTQYFWEATIEANRIEEARQKQFAADLIAKNIAAQATTRQQQEDAVKVSNESRPSTINIDDADPDWSFNTSATAGQPIVVAGPLDLNVDFTPEYTESFVISGGMDSPTVYFSEDEQPVGVAVHELTAQYDIGF